MGVFLIKSSLHWESRYPLKSILRMGVLRMWQSIIIAQGSLFLGQGPRYLWVDVLNKDILARL